MCLVWLKSSQYGVPEMKILKFHEFNFAIIYPMKRMWSLMWTNWNPLHPRMICAKVGWNWPCVSGEKENVKRLQLDRRQMTNDQKSWLQFQFRWAKINLVFYVCGCMFVVFSFILVFLPVIYYWRHCHCRCKALNLQFKYILSKLLNNGATIK